jgi:hypothetical protein
VGAFEPDLYYVRPHGTRGTALHLLGKVQTGYDLYLEIPGEGLEVLVCNSAQFDRLQDHQQLLVHSIN